MHITRFFMHITRHETEREWEEYLSIYLETREI